MINPSSFWIAAFIVLAIAVIFMFVWGCLTAGRELPDDHVVIDAGGLMDLAKTDKPYPTGWQGWEGGDCPLADGTPCKMMTRNGNMISTEWAEDWRWEHVENDYDIIAYRLA